MNSLIASAINEIVYVSSCMQHMIKTYIVLVNFNHFEVSELQFEVNKISQQYQVVGTVCVV